MFYLIWQLWAAVVIDTLVILQSNELNLLIKYVFLSIIYKYIHHKFFHNVPHSQLKSVLKITDHCHQWKNSHNWWLTKYLIKY